MSTSIYPSPSLSPFLSSIFISFSLAISFFLAISISLYYTENKTVRNRVVQYAAFCLFMGTLPKIVLYFAEPEKEKSKTTAKLKDKPRSPLSETYCERLLPSRHPSFLITDYLLMRYFIIYVGFKKYFLKGYISLNKTR
jgi:hypothetical protein